jgi:hypothetical protein
MPPPRVAKMYSGLSAVPTSATRSSLPFSSTFIRSPSLRLRASRKRWFTTTSPRAFGAGQRPLLSVSRFMPPGCSKSWPIRRAIIGGTTPGMESCASRTTRDSTSMTPGIPRILSRSQAGARLAVAKTCGKRAVA